MLQAASILLHDDKNCNTVNLRKRDSYFTAAKNGSGALFGEQN